jgi:hypothetical protein
MGVNIAPDTINGLSIWSASGDGHPTEEGLENLYIENNILKSNYHPGKEIHIASLTFFTLTKLMNLPKFHNLFPSGTFVEPAATSRASAPKFPALQNLASAGFLRRLLPPRRRV